MMTETASLSTVAIGELFAQASSVAPVPGGGCVSAVCGYLAVSLLLKSIRISARAHPEDTSFAAIDEKLVASAGQLLTLAGADSDSFGDYMRAVKLPKTTPDEVVVRKKAMHDAAVGATVSALNILDAGNDILDITHHVQGRVAKSILADERSAVELVSAMNSTAQWNAEANMVSIREETALTTRLQDAKAKHAALLAACHGDGG
jgi:formiminotetrahydrofolate cyclodeaminase